MNFFRALVDDVCGVIKKIAQTREDLCVQPALNISDCLLCWRVVFLCGGGQKFHAVLPIIARIAVKQSDLHARPEVKPGGFFKMSKPLFGLPVLIIQLADFILDRAYFAEICAAAKNLGSAFLKGYAQMLIDAANLRSAVRTMRMNKDTEFLKTALIPGGGIDTGRVLAAFGSGDTLASIYANTLLENAAALGAAAVKGGTMTEFELACDNAVTAYLTGARLVSYGEAPAIAYLAAVEGETTALRMILTGMLAGLPTETIRERLRDTYV